MKLIASEFGQALQLVVMDEIRAQPPIPAPDIVRLIGERYEFVTKPTNLSEAVTLGYKFAMGIIEVDGRRVPINGLDIYNDGFLVNSYHTDLADLVMDDFIEWGTKEFHLREPVTKIPRRHSANVIVEFEHSMDRFLRHAQRMFKLIEAPLRKALRKEVDVGLMRLAVGVDPTLGIPAIQSTFAIDLRAGQSLGAHRYFVSAPFSTPELLDVLSELERVAAD